MSITSRTAVLKADDSNATGIPVPAGVVAAPGNVPRGHSTHRSPGGLTPELRSSPLRPRAGA